MDNKFLEEGATILNEIIRYSSEFNDWTINDKKIAIKVIADTLDLLSSKHKEDVRALREAIAGKAANRIEADGWPEEDKQRWMGFFNAGHESAMEAFDSTLKDLGIEL